MKKLFASFLSVLLISVLAFSLTGCSKKYTVTFVSYVSKPTLSLSGKIEYDTYLTKEVEAGSIIGNIEIDETMELYDSEIKDKRTYKFCGWYTDKSYGIQWNLMLDPVNGDITLYAKWE